jgi:hypothetical protein
MEAAMQRLAVLFALSAFLILGACEQREQAQAPQSPGVTKQEPAPQPPAVQPTPGSQAQQPAGEQQTAAQPSAGMQERPGDRQEEPVRQPGIAGQPAAPGAEGQQQERPAGQSREAAEFMGQAPKVEDAPEKVVLEAKNGNVTLPHRAHAGMMECKTCHGDAKPGKMADFNKDKAHALCQGCHKEKGAGPTKCPDCHKK